MTRYRAAALLALAIAGDCAALLALIPAARSAATGLRSPQSWLDQVGPDAATATLAAALLWLVALWLALGLGAAVLTYAPGRTGSQAGALARLVLPRAFARLVAGATGVSILLAPVAAGAAAPTPGTTLSTATGAAPIVPSPVLPTSPSPAGLPAPALPSRVQLPPQPPQPPRPTTPSTTVDHATVTVQSGDSLWTIAARQLAPGANPAQIAVQWPRWYARNRTVIGTDPGLIQPGQVLQTPLQAPSPEE